jgi:GTP-binding protein LepA
MRRPVVLALRRTYSSAAPTSAVHKLTPDDYARALSSPDAHVRTRNFCIVAHIDHGKSTLADRLLQATGREAQADQTQVLDTLQVEKERGITVKANTATMLYTPKGEKLPFVLNLIDTPGHVDFSFEVNRSVNACDGALLLVDSTQGIQAQTLANYRMVKKANLDVIPLLTKLDLQHSFPDGIKEQLFYVLDIDPDHVIETSAKANIGIQETLDRIVKDISPPKVDLDSMNKRLKCHLLDSWFDQSVSRAN